MKRGQTNEGRRQTEACFQEYGSILKITDRLSLKTREKGSDFRKLLLDLIFWLIPER